MKIAAFKNMAVAACLTLAASGAMGDPAPSCDKIATDVRDAVAKDPSKVLMIVEDALVINESCACEIVKAAIVASSADEALMKQIVATAVAVAPKMTAVIQECAAAAMGAQTAVETSGKSGAGKQGAGKQGAGKEPVFSVQPPKEETVDYSQGGRVDIRGVYLTLPAAGGFVVTEDDDDSHDSKTYKHTVIIKERKTVIVPVSPTSPKPGDPKPGDPKK